mgnify:FL=1|tara:strand:- start:8 stop:175 length:168 start_codon:yes stop_codon:yes gene_type:complete
MKENKEATNNNMRKYAFFSIVLILIAAFGYVIWGENSNIDVDEMLKHVNTGEVPF